MLDRLEDETERVLGELTEMIRSYLVAHLEARARSRVS